MVKVVGVRFKKAGKVYYFDPGALEPAMDEPVIVETDRGLEIGRVVIPCREMEENEKFMPLSPVIRIATPADLAQDESNSEKEKEAFRICEEKIAKHKLLMKLIDVEYTFDNNKIIFSFVADGRIDFRDLVKDLASVFRTRIELRQIGVRDETKTIGGLGVCGRKICCTDFLSEFTPVSVKMAKDQSLSTNPQKISGACGKLICCLNYEQAAYEEAYKTIPRVGSYVQTPEGRGTVVESNVVSEKVKVRVEKDDTTALSVFAAGEVKMIRPQAKKQEAAAEPETEQ